MPPSTSWKEEIPPDEAARFERYAEELGAFQRSIASKSGVMARALHAKGNLALEATFEVLGDLPEHARVGLFSAAKKYAALVRYSNGSGKRQADSEPDVRGIAVKLVGVEGKKTIPGLEGAKTQDFLAIRTPSTPVRNADEFMKLVRAASTPALAPFKLLFSLGPFRMADVLGQVLKSFKMPSTPLSTTTYYSAAPLSYGPYAVHFAFFPAESNAVNESSADRPIVRGAGVDALGDQLSTDARAHDLVYDFAVQFFVDDRATPIEDNAIEWTAEVAPWVKVGRLTIPQQDPKSARGKRIVDYAEKLSFDPWHTLEEMRPIGSIMRARNYAYRKSTENRSALPEPEAFPNFDAD